MNTALGFLSHLLVTLARLLQVLSGVRPGRNHPSLSLSLFLCLSLSLSLHLYVYPL